MQNLNRAILEKELLRTHRINNIVGWVEDHHARW